jgi:hypothetical protein
MRLGADWLFSGRETASSRQGIAVQSIQNNRRNSKPMKKIAALLGMTAGIGLGGLSASAATYTNNFDTDPSTDNQIVISGNGASWQPTGGNPDTGGFLRITPAQGSQFGAILFKDFDQGLVVAGFTFECDVRIGNGTTSPADGFSINYVRAGDPVLQYASTNNGTIAANAGFSDNGASGDLSLPEEGCQTGISIGFDAWDSGAITSPPTPPAVGQAGPGITHDYPGIDIRVDNVLVDLVQMPTLNGSVTDATSLQTGPNDGSNSENGLGWAHVKVVLATNGVLNVYYKNTLILSNYQTSYFPSPGRLIFAGRTGGSYQVQDIDNVSLTTVAAAKPLMVIGQATVTDTGGTISVFDAPPSVADTNTIALKLNGTAITPASVTKSTNGTTTITFQSSQFFASGSTNTVSLTIKDTQSPPQTVTADRTAIAPIYVSIPAAYALPPNSGDSTKPGFLVHPYSTTAAQPNTMIWTEEQLAGLHGPNLADFSQIIGTSGADSNGFYSVSDVINWDVNTAASDGHFNTPDYPDIEQPGWPNTAGATANSSEEVLTYLSFPAAGFYTMGVNSDDGFKVTTGISPRDPFSAILLGAFDVAGGRGAADTTFTLLVPQAGVYPFRLIYENGGGGANCEWFTETNGVFQLINDTTNSVKAYQAVTASAGMPVSVSGVFPPPNAGSVFAGTNIVIQISDGSSAQLSPASVQLMVNGATQQVTITKSGAVSTITGSPLPPGLLAATFVYGDNSTPPKTVTGKWSFTVVGLTTNMAVANIDTSKPGFWVHPYQTTNAQPNTLAWTEDQLAGLHGPSIADLSKADASGFIAVTGVVNWDIGGATSTNGDFNTPTNPDTVQPGWVLTGGLAPNATEEVYTYLYFPTNGTYTMGVNSDDGFKVTAGSPLKGPTAVILGSFDAGRGAADTLFTFPVAAAGYYPFRLLYENGGGGANCEWFTQLADGTDVLINDPTNPNSIKAYMGPEPTPVVSSGPKFNPPTQTNGVVTLTWTGSATLQQATNLTGQASDWSNVTPAPTGTTFTVTATNGPPMTFYRLKQ